MEGSGRRFPRGQRPAKVCGRRGGREGRAAPAPAPARLPQQRSPLPHGRVSGGTPTALSRGQPCPRGLSSRAPPASISTSTRERFAQTQFFPVCYEGTVATAKLGALGTFRRSAQSMLSLLEILPFRPWHP